MFVVVVVDKVPSGSYNIASESLIILCPAATYENQTHPVSIIMETVSHCVFATWRVDSFNVLMASWARVAFKQEFFEVLQYSAISCLLEKQDVPWEPGLYLLTQITKSTVWKCLAVDIKDLTDIFAFLTSEF